MGSDNLVKAFMVHKKPAPKGGVLSFYRGGQLKHQIFFHF